MQWLDRHTVALWYLRPLPREAATARMRSGIQRYNASIGGNPDSYHETITLAWLAVINRFLKENDRGQSQAELTKQLIAECGDKDYLLRYYTRERLLSEAARSQGYSRTTSDSRLHTTISDHWQRTTDDGPNHGTSTLPPFPASRCRCQEPHS
jgi:hypothetical protein